MRQKVLLALTVGAVLGALFGLAEAVVWFFQIPIPWWKLEISAAALAMLIYGILNALANALWAFIAGNMDQAAFQKRTFAFSLLTMVYLFGGYYVNRIFFPEIYTSKSLVFTGAWTIVWLLGVWGLVKFRIAPHSPKSNQTTSAVFLRTAALGIVLIIINLSLLSPRLWAMSPWMRRAEAAPVALDRPNVLLIVMDTTRADHLSSYGFPRSITPHVDQLAQEGVLFENASSAASWTLPSHASLFTGLHPSQHGADWPHQRLDNRFTTLAELLQSHGYQTAGFSNNPWLSRATNFQQGFDYFEETWLGGRLFNRLAIVRMRDKLVELATKSRDNRARLTNGDIKRWFQDAYKAERPVFLFVNFLEPHFVYEPPEPYRSRFLKEENKLTAEKLPLRTMRHSVPPVQFDQKTRDALNDLYDGEIAYLDKRVGEVVEELKKRQLLENTVVIITSDHGENIGDHGIFEHQFCVYETLLHVPLILRYPKELPKATRVKEPVSLVDVMPTLTELLGIEAPELQEYLSGKSLLDSSQAASQERSVITEYVPPVHQLERYRKEGKIVDEKYFTRSLKSLRKGDFKFIWASNGNHELYNLIQDPDESQNLIEKFPDKVREMENELKNQLLNMKASGQPEEAVELDETTRQQLKGLGYLQ